MKARSVSLLILLIISFSVAGASDFPRFTYNPPRTTHPDARFLYYQMGDCGFNLVMNSGQTYRTLDEYLTLLHNNGMKAILREGRIGAPGRFLIEYHSCGQYHRYQAEQRYDEAVDMGPRGWYHFWHGNSPDFMRGKRDTKHPAGGISWQCRKGKDKAGIILKGPYETPRGREYMGDWKGQTDWPEYTGVRQYISRFNVRADLSQLESLDDPVFEVTIRQHGEVDETIANRIYTGQSFKDVEFPEWQLLELYYAVIDSRAIWGQYRIQYEINWYGNCDFWIDFIEYMDLDRAAGLFYDEATRDQTVRNIYYECLPLQEPNQDRIFGWFQSDEPIRSSFWTHGLVNRLVADALGKPAITTILESRLSERADLFVEYADPDILLIDKYIFQANHSLDSQEELDSLAHSIESAYQATQLADPAPPLWVALQGYQTITNYYYRAPGKLRTRPPSTAEMKVQTYIALAHGAKGIGYWKYTSTKRGESSNFKEGLLDTLDQPTDRWYTVKELNQFLDQVGDLLISLERDTAFCARDGGFTTPLVNVALRNSKSGDIEVGQFHDPEGHHYLLLVNRCTANECFIDVFTEMNKKKDQFILEDVYTREKFISDDSNFLGIRFGAGEGRLLRLVTQ